jgi:hypothetical protein
MNVDGRVERRPRCLAILAAALAMMSQMTRAFPTAPFRHRRRL